MKKRFRAPALQNQLPFNMRFTIKSFIQPHPMTFNRLKKSLIKQTILSNCCEKTSSFDPSAMQKKIMIHICKKLLYSSVHL